MNIILSHYVCVYDKTFGPKVVLGHCDLITSFGDFAFYLGLSFGIGTYFFHIMFAYDKTFDPKVFLGHCDLISCFSDFALYLHTQLVYFHMSLLL